MNNKFEPIASIYKKHTLLHQLSVRSQQLQKLNKLVIESLPSQLRSHCYLANINENTVIMHTDNASYATLLRFQAHAVFHALSSHLPHIISKLDVRVRPPLYEKTAQLHPLTLPAKTATIIEQTAENIDNQELKCALRKLAKRAEKQSS